MRLERTRVDWWDGYDTLMVADTPRVPTAAEIVRLLDWATHHLHTVFVPVPFAELVALRPLRQHPELRWEAVAQSYGDLTGRSVIDIGGATGYYAFLARAAGAERATLLDGWGDAVALARQVADLYGVDGFETAVDLMERWPWADRHYDVGFAFSSLPYLGQRDPGAMAETLSAMRGAIDVLYVEMGDGGSALPGAETEAEQHALFAAAGWRPLMIGRTWATHSDTMRPIWRLDR